jgi:hypothetical protein
MISDATLANQALVTVGADVHYAARIGCPDAAIGFGQDAFRALEIYPKGLYAGTIKLPADQGVVLGAH